MNNLNKFSDIKAFRYSLDWRFFLPISETSRLLYIGEGGEEVQSFFRRLNVNSVFYSSDDVVKAIGTYSASFSKFDIVSIPYNFISHHLYEEIKKILTPSGSLLIGFANHYKSNNKNTASVFKLRSLLEKAGFSHIKCYGAFSDEYAPQYIFPLNPHTFKFVIRHRYESRVPTWVLSLLFLSPSIFFLSYFIPAYYIVAQVDYA